MVTRLHSPVSRDSDFLIPSGPRLSLFSKSAVFVALLFFRRNFFLSKEHRMLRLLSAFPTVASEDFF